MSHCPGCEDRDCQGATHLCEVVIDEDEFRKAIYHITLGLGDPTNSAKLELARLWLRTLTGYDTRTEK
jgi:hypothetical protein